MATWKQIANTSQTNSQGIKVSLKGGNSEIFKVSDNLTELVAQVYNTEDPKYQTLVIGSWLKNGEWINLAEFSPGIWLYVRPL